MQQKSVADYMMENEDRKINNNYKSSISDAQKFKTEQAKKERLLGIMSSITDQYTHDKAVQMARQEGFDVPDGVYDPRDVDMAIKQLSSTKDESGFKVVGDQVVQLNSRTGEVKPVYTAPDRGLTAAQQAVKDARDAAALERKDKEVQSGAERYSKTVDSNGLADLMLAAERAGNATSGDGDIAGYGEFVGGMPDWAISQAGKDTRQEISSLQNAILKARSGGAVTPAEADRFMTEIGAGFGRGDSNVRQGIANLRAALEEKVKNAQAGFAPEAIEKYKAGGGTIVAGRLQPNAGKNLKTKVGGSTGGWTIEPVEE
jgi:hypothetical protein